MLICSIIMFCLVITLQEYIQRFENEKIGLQELGHLNEEDLADLGLPLGPRLRILHEAKQL